MIENSAVPTSRTAGSQTLARGIAVLKAVAAAKTGMTIQEVADEIAVHRTIAYRILNTLSDAELVHKGSDSRYRGASGLLKLSSAAHSAMREAAMPVLADLANELEQTVSLLVREGAEAVALAVVEPRNRSYRISFAEGSRHPLDLGAAGHAISSCLPPSPVESEAVRTARVNGYSLTFGEVEPNMYGLAAPIRNATLESSACINLITTRKELAESSVEVIVAAAKRISSLLV